LKLNTLKGYARAFGNQMFSKQIPRGGSAHSALYKCLIGSRADRILALDDRNDAEWVRRRDRRREHSPIRHIKLYPLRHHLPGGLVAERTRGRAKR